MIKMKLKKGDLVKVIAGKDKTKTGVITKMFPENSKALVQGINLVKRHEKEGIRTKEMPIHISNLAMVDPENKEKVTKISYKLDEKTGKKRRVAKASGKFLDN